MRLRVLHIINDLRVGGAEALLRDLTSRLHGGDDGIEVAVTALQPNPTFVEQAVRDGGVPFTFHPAEWGFRSPKHVSRLAEQMRGFDVVHVHLFPAQLWAALAWRKLSRGRRPALVTTEHNTTNRRRTAGFRPVDRWMYGHYRRLVGVSGPVADRLAGWIGVPSETIAVIPTAIDFDRFAGAEPARKADLLGIPGATPVLVCVGRLEAQKDQATLLRALPLLAGHHAALVGDGPLRGDLEALAASLGVADRVHFLGRRPDVPSLLKMADVYVQPSRFEGWSIAILEAMASAHAPIVAAEAPGLGEAVAGRGWLFPVGDHAALADAVRTAASDKNESARRVAAGREYSAGFRLERCVDAHRALYRELVGSTDSAR